MKEQWNRVSERIAKMSLRERTMVLAALLALAYVLIDTALLSPVLARRKAALEQQAQLQTELTALQAQLKARAAGQAVDPDAAGRARLAELQAKIAAAEKQAKEQSTQLIPAQRMRSVLQQMLAGRSGLELVELRTLPQSTIELAPEPNAAAKAPAPAPSQAAPIYKHGVQLVVRGRYLDLLAYLKDIERMPVRLYWDTLDVSVLDHPTLLMKVTLYTISLDKAWLQV